MRRRVKEADEGFMPARLRVYDSRDWPQPECHPECAFWEAVAAWREAHRHEPEGAAILFVDGPDVPWHDELI